MPRAKVVYFDTFGNVIVFTEMNVRTLHARPARPEARGASGAAAPSVPPTSEPRSGIVPETSSALQRDSIVTIKGRPSALGSCSPAAGRESAAAVGDPSPPPASGRWSWPDLLRHTFAVDVLACPRCGGRMRVLATIDDPSVIRKILTHLGLPTDVPAPRPPPSDLFS
jgi:hypothetical protein